jgi:hypothetical protein
MSWIILFGIKKLKAFTNAKIKAEEINKELAEGEPYDRQMEYEI